MKKFPSKWTSLIVEDQALFTSRQPYHRHRMSHGRAHLVQAWVQETNWSWWTNCHQNQPAWDWRIRFGSGTDGWTWTTIPEAIRDQWTIQLNQQDRTNLIAASLTAPEPHQILKLEQRLRKYSLNEPRMRDSPGSLAWLTISLMGIWKIVLDNFRWWDFISSEQIKDI